MQKNEDTNGEGSGVSRLRRPAGAGGKKRVQGFVIAALRALTVIFLTLLPVQASVVHSHAAGPGPSKPALSPGIDSPMPDKIELGKMLFFDRRLSGDGTTSCATCHIPEQAFADGQDISQSYPTTRNWRNAPSLLNVGSRETLFWDGRAQSLEEQALFPLMAAFEMNQNLDFVEEELRVVPEYSGAFQRLFGGEPTRERIAMAIAAFERTLVSLNVPYDRFLGGQKTALSAEAKRGLDIFTGKGRCAECHSGPALSDGRFHALNVPENPVLLNDPMVTATMRFVAKVYHYPDFRVLKEDPGRYLITKDKKDWRAFRTAPLRDISKSAPYMHNGIFKTLEEVIDFFDRGGGAGNTVLRPLGLSEDEKKLLKTFMIEALSGEEIPFRYPVVP